MTKSRRNFSHTLENGVNRQMEHLAKHWLLVANVLVGLFVSLPYLAPILMHYGYTAPANVIYRAYRLTCHQLPSRSFFIFERQAAFCQRDTAIWAAFFIGGLVFAIARGKLKELPFHWWILALIPIGLDGGTQLVGPLYEILPDWILTGFAVLVWLALTAILYSRKVSHWQYYLFVVCLPLGMIFVQVTGPRLSTWPLRTMTGSIFGLANAWLIFPALAETFQEVQADLDNKGLRQEAQN